MAKLVMCLLGVCLLGQYAWGFWGTGMWGALQHCGFEVARSSEVEAIEEEIKERKKDLERTRSELRKKEGRQKILRTRIQGTKESLKQIGFQGDALNFLENHIRNQKKCGEYCSAAGGPPPCNPTNPFPLEQWKPHCGPNDGEVRDTICEVNVSRAPHFHEDRCKERINKWMEDEKELREVTKEVEELKSKIKVLSAELKILGVDLKEARKIYQEELREQILEGECVDCYIVGNQVYRPRKPSGAEILGHVALGAIGSLFQHRLNKYAIDSNAKLGFATQPYPAFMAGFPYFMGALYGAIGGSLGYGGFGCFGGPFGPYGALGPLGLMGVYGNAGMWGYPPGLMGNMMGGLAGGIFLPGMGPWGMNGPWGSAMCITWPCPPMMGGMGGLFPGIFPGMGMNMLGGFPSMFPGMNMLGGFPSMFPGMNMLGGFPSMFPGMNMLGGFFPGNFPGLNMAGGFFPGTFPGMDMGMMSAMQMQMYAQQQMMEMQMQLYQNMMQAQQRRLQNYMAHQRVMASLTQEMYTLMFRIQQVQMAMMYDGYAPITPPGLGINPPGGYPAWPPMPTIPPGGTQPLPGGGSSPVPRAR